VKEISVATFTLLGPGSSSDRCEKLGLTSELITSAWISAAFLQQQCSAPMAHRWNGNMSLSGGVQWMVFLICGFPSCPCSASAKCLNDYLDRNVASVLIGAESDGMLSFWSRGQRATCTEIKHLLNFWVQTSCPRLKTKPSNFCLGVP
jgi:hypothetical protein